MTLQGKEGFLKEEMFGLFNKLQADAKPVWGKMNAQQMTEHVADVFDISANKISIPLLTPEEHLPKYLEFLRSEKRFRENTKAPEQFIGEEPQAIRCIGIHESIKTLELSVNDFFYYFIENPTSKTMHPGFGPLGYEDWVLLHYKHATHHLVQFNLI